MGYCFGQAAGPGFWEAVSNYGMAGAVIIVTVFFLLYLRDLNSRDERMEERRSKVAEGLQSELRLLSGAIARLDGHLRLRPPAEDFPG